MGISNSIYEFIMDMLGESGGAVEIGRNELAGHFSCVPSQINYVLSTRFTPERGYLVESRRGGGGYIRITRIQNTSAPSLLPILHCIGDSLNEPTALYFITGLVSSGLISAREAAMMKAAVSEKSLGTGQEAVRASVFKNMLLALGSVKP